MIPDASDSPADDYERRYADRRRRASRWVAVAVSVSFVGRPAAIGAVVATDQFTRGPGGQDELSVFLGGLAVGAPAAIAAGVVARLDRALPPHRSTPFEAMRTSRRNVTFPLDFAAIAVLQKEAARRKMSLAASLNEIVTPTVDEIRARAPEQNGETSSRDQLSIPTPPLIPRGANRRG